MRTTSGASPGSGRGDSRGRVRRTRTVLTVRPRPRVGASSHNGTVDRSDDTVAGFSSRGPGAIDFQAKPDLVAPGVGIESLGEAGTTLYNTKPLMRLVLNQVGRMLTEDLHAPRKHPLLLLLDEFPALGRLDFFESALAFIAGYGIKAFLMACLKITPRSGNPFAQAVRM